MHGMHVIGTSERFLNHLIQSGFANRAFHRSFDSDQDFGEHIANYLIQIGTSERVCESLF